MEVIHIRDILLYERLNLDALTPIQILYSKVIYKLVGYQAVCMGGCLLYLSYV
jgi:hypothetical protein